MKIRTIICFIFSILGLLALVAYFFPEDGIAVGSVRMKFPSLTEVLQTEEEKETLPTDTVSTDTLSTEELLQMRMDALKAENQMLWVQKMNNLRNAAMEIVSNELIYR